MPNFYSHLRFGREVLWELSPELQKQLSREWASFLCGNFGPDPLYFGGNRLRRVGLSIHYGSGEQAMGRFRRPLELGTPWAVSFSLGYLCHFLLDSSMHPLVYEAMEATGCSHRKIEGEFDRFLMERDGVTAREAFPRWKGQDAFAAVAAQMAPEVSREDYIRSLREFRRVSENLCRWTGTPMVAVVNGVGLIPGIQGARGAVLRRKPDAVLLPWMKRMEEAFRERVKGAPEILEKFLKKARQGQSFSFLSHCNYAGEKDV